MEFCCIVVTLTHSDWDSDWLRQVGDIPRSKRSVQKVSTASQSLNGSFTIGVYTPFTPLSCDSTQANIMSKDCMKSVHSIQLLNWFYNCSVHFFYTFARHSIYTPFSEESHLPHWNGSQLACSCSSAEVLLHTLMCKMHKSHNIWKQEALDFNTKYFWINPGWVTQSASCILLEQKS